MLGISRRCGPVANAEVIGMPAPLAARHDEMSQGVLTSAPSSRKGNSV